MATTTATGSGSTTTPAQYTDMMYMVRPTYFDFNVETAGDNAFQKRLAGLTLAQARKQAHEEFEALESMLKSNKIRVHVEDCPVEEASDAVFPNNHLSFHNEDGRRRIVLYPMMAKNRRLERQPDVVASWKQRLGAEVVDYTAFEDEGKFLEGTGSMVLDRVNRIAYGSISERTYPVVMERFCSDFGYKRIIFQATHEVKGKRQPIYHANVMMSIGDRFAIVGFDNIVNPEERKLVRETLESTGKEIIPISESQVTEYGGNSLQVNNVDGETFFVCSTRAFNAYQSDQLGAIQKYCHKVLHVPLDTIEALGGGGARCMLCEVFPSPQ